MQSPREYITIKNPSVSTAPSVNNNFKGLEYSSQKNYSRSPESDSESSHFQRGSVHQVNENVKPSDTNTQKTSNKKTDVSLIKKLIIKKRGSVCNICLDKHASIIYSCCIHSVCLSCSVEWHVDKSVKRCPFCNSILS